MNTLQDHVILYDAECPMCKIYTNAFVTTGMLDSEGRAPYQDMPQPLCPLVDRQRAVNEIALVNKVTGEVQYGIDSLFKVIAHSFPLFRPLFTFRPFIWLMRKVYAFVSYNRKVIIPAPRPRAGSTTGSVSDLQPSFRLGYRIAWLLFATWVAGTLLSVYTDNYHAYLACLALPLFQGLFMTFYSPRKKWDYLGNMMTISLAGSLLLLPGLALGAIFHLPRAFSISYLLLICLLMCIEHIRRMQLLGLGCIVNASWFLFGTAELLFLL